MSYLDAAQHAQQAINYADSARRQSNDLHERKMAQATSELSAAVKALAEQLHRDS
ncbi:hypothetical protein [Microbacterium sp. 16-032]|uniref:hypothetical protein n=1 Tax=Microbacterium sp. 16-032 TaxID=3239808 RepID=UPI0034E294AA